MNIKSKFENLINDVQDGFKMSITQYCLKKLNPRTLISKNQFVRNSYISSPNEGVNHFYEIDTEGNLAFYLVCDGQKSLEWILEDLMYKISKENNCIYLKFIVGAKSIVIPFMLKDTYSLYCLTRIVIQSNIMLYYLMENKKEYIYLGYNEINISKETKEYIIKNINYEIETEKIEAK